MTCITHLKIIIGSVPSCSHIIDHNEHHLSSIRQMEEDETKANDHNGKK
jgi:hypothetical protein